MSDVMSQSEIDDLLSALSAGEVDVNDMDETKEKKVKQYDFRRPDKFAKDQLRTLEIIHDNIGRLVNNFLSGYLRSVVEIEVISTESMVYSEFSNSISNPAILGIVDFKPLDGQIILEINNDIAFCMVEKLLGCQSASKLKEPRELTEIESVLIKNIMNKFIEYMLEPWSTIIELAPRLVNIETNSQFAQIASPSDSIALVTYNIKIGDIEGMINLGIPHYVIEPILPNLSSRLWFASGHKRDKDKIETAALVGSLKSSYVPVRAVVGKSDINIYELLTLCLGDVLVLNSHKNQELDIYVKDELKFRGMPGISRNKMAVKITEVVEEKGIEIDG